eukprot:NODE_1335_length_1465_cov_10.437853_g151_i1.p1 GENE.NODE_1335_length_1465_cov_10.437853_g151_i1~~NODE_1335_length_1465_cov_10.437853_g151_i1.p1  ORF type:complete len:384 (+),score=36.48 NODE_1335_length_1465_cov_10.437853_g151_i1:163-1314(+)
MGYIGLCLLSFFPCYLAPLPSCCGIMMYSSHNQFYFYSGSAVEEPSETHASKKRGRESMRMLARRLVIENSFTSGDALLREANRLEDAGEPRLASWLQTLSAAEFVREVWFSREASDRLVRVGASRLELLDLAREKKCVCGGKWAETATELLRLNGLCPEEFARALLECLEKGAGKHMNIFLEGPGNCGKSWLLEPLEEIFRAFAKPDEKASFPLIDLHAHEIVLWQDFRVPCALKWSQLLVFLEGGTVTVNRPQNSYSGHDQFRVMMPILATGASVPGHPDATEDVMMRLRWRKFTFSHVIQERAEKRVARCGRCFASWLRALTAPRITAAPSRSSKKTPARSSSRTSMHRSQSPLPTSQISVPMSQEPPLFSSFARLLSRK